MFATPHCWLTWALTLPPNARGLYRPRAIWEPIGYTSLLAIGVPVTHHVGGWDLLFTAITMIGFYHVTRQHLGILKLYDARYAQVYGDPGVFKAMEPFHQAMVLLLAFPILRVWQLPLFDIAIGPQKFTLLHPVLPEWTTWPYLVALGWYAGRAARELARRQREGKPWPHAHFLVGGVAALSYAAAFGLVPTRDYLLTVAIFITYHDLQYAGFVWHFQRLRGEHEAGRGVRLDAIHRWAREGKAVPYFALAFLYSAAVFGLMLILPGLVAMAFVTFQTMVHQIMDGWIWKRRYYPQVQVHLGLEPGRTPA